MLDTSGIGQGDTKGSQPVSGTLAVARQTRPRAIKEPKLQGRLIECSGRDIIPFGRDWDRLAAGQPQYVPTFSDAIHELNDPNIDIRLVGWRVGDSIAALALFRIHRTTRRYWLGEKAVMRMPVLAAELYGGASVGSVDVSAAKAMLDSIMRDRSIDLVTFGDVPQSDSFYHVVASRAWHGPTSVSHHRATRRLALLPATMAEYWGQLRSTTRKAGQRDLKIFERLAPTYIVTTEPDQVADFLSRAAKINDRTYQKKLEVGIEDTPDKRRHLERLAAAGRLRCYMSNVDGEDVAYAWGDVSHGVFYYRTTGFDPAFARHCPGRAILLTMIRDLIESGAAHTFDFSGRDTEAKSRFGTSAIECANFLVTRWSRPRGVAAVWLDRLFNVPKALAARLLSPARMERLRRAIRGGR